MPGGDEDADAIGDLRRHVQPRIVDRELRGGERELDEDVHLLDVFLSTNCSGSKPLIESFKPSNVLANSFSISAPRRPRRRSRDPGRPPRATTNRPEIGVVFLLYASM